MNALEERRLALLKTKIAARAELVGDFEVLAERVRNEKQSPEEWIQLAESQLTAPNFADDSEAGE